MSVDMKNKGEYCELEVVNVRLVKEPSIISETPVRTSEAAAELIKNMLSQFDREEEIMASEKYEDLIEEIEIKLDEADKAAAEDDVRYTADEIFSRVRERIERL